MKFELVILYATAITAKKCITIPHAYIHQKWNLYLNLDSQTHTLKKQAYMFVCLDF